MEIREQQHGAVKGITPKGPLCTQDVPEFQRLVQNAIAATMGRCVIDLSETPYVDSQGLESLLTLSELLADSGRTLKLCGLCETVKEILDLTDLAAKVEQYEDMNSAVRSFL